MCILLVVEWSTRTSKTSLSKPPVPLATKFPMVPFWLVPVVVLGAGNSFNSATAWDERGRVATGMILPLKARSEEHTSELQSRLHLVCRLLLEKKKKKYTT